MEKIFFLFLKSFLRKAIIEIIIDDLNQDGLLRSLLRTHMPKKGQKEIKNTIEPII